MNTKHLISGILRLICGLALIVYAILTYGRIGAGVAAGQPILLFGKMVDVSPVQMWLALGVAGLVGLGLIILGMMTLRRKET